MESSKQTVIHEAVSTSVTDAKTAQRAGIKFIATLSGVTPREAFEDYNTMLSLKMSPNYSIY